jgi:hypothetical protein
MSTVRTNEVRMLDDVGKAVFTFDSVQDMEVSSQLVIGQRVRTLGYQTPGDFGGNEYEIVAPTGVHDGGVYIDLAGSGLQARSLEPTKFNVAQLGIFGDGVTDHQPRFQQFLNSIPSGEFFFNPGVYRFGNYIDPRDNQKILGGNRETTTLLWDNETAGIRAFQAIKSVRIQGLGLTQDFDPVNHDITGGQTEVQQPLIRIRDSGAQKWHIEDCKFFRIARQAISGIGPNDDWVVVRNRFEDVSREAFFFLSGSGGAFKGCIFAENHCINCGDDVLNFRNGYNNICVDNYFDCAGESHPSLQDPGGTVHSAIKVHGDNNIFSNNTIENAGNRVYESRASNPLGGEGEVGAPRGNIFCNNTIRGTQSVRTNTQAIGIAASDGGVNSVFGNIIEWKSDARAIALLAPQEGWPETQPNPGSSVFIRNNQINKCTFPVEIRSNASCDIVVIEDNFFDNVEEGTIINASGSSYLVNQLVFKNNKIRFAGSGPSSGTVINFGSQTSSTLSWIEIDSNEILNGTITSLDSIGSVGVAGRIDYIAFTNNNFSPTASNTLLQNAEEIIFQYRGGNQERVFRLVDDTVKTIPAAWFLSKHMTMVTAFKSERLISWLKPNSAGGAIDSEAIAIGSNTTLVNSTNLTGTTGTDGRITVACNDGNVQFENRVGGTRTFRVSFV